MVSNLDDAEGPPPAPQPPPPKTLKGIGIVVAAEQADGSKEVLGVIFAPTREKLVALVQTLHQSPLTVNLADIRGGTVTLGHPPK